MFSFTRFLCLVLLVFILACTLFLDFLDYGSISVVKLEIEFVLFEKCDFLKMVSLDCA